MANASSAGLVLPWPSGHREPGGRHGEAMQFYFFFVLS
jgi:hypothetical protein